MRKILRQNTNLLLFSNFICYTYKNKAKEGEKILEALKTFIIEFCSYIAKNDVIISLCSITSLIGFCITIYVSLKTRSIDKRIEELNSIKNFNKKRNNHIGTLKSYQASLTEDNVDIKKIRTNILNDINIIAESYKYIFTWRQKLTIYCLKKNLENQNKIDETKVCNLLSVIIAYLSNKKGD